MPCPPAGNDYNEGDIRLVGGSYSWEGRVEIYLNGEWGTITDYATSAFDAHVVCRQLGYDTRCKLVCYCFEQVGWEGGKTACRIVIVVYHTL